MTSPRFFLDEHVPVAVAPQLRRRGIDCISTREAGRLGLSDADHLDWARTERRIVVSFDNDFLALVKGSSFHAGVIRCTIHTREVGSIVRALVKFTGERTAEGAAGSVWYI